MFKKGILKLEDLEASMELKGTVLNVVDFGAFIDIGLKDSGLVHISQMANRYVKSPYEVAAVGDVVNVWVLAVKQAEGGKGETIIRIQERTGSATEATLKSALLGLDHKVALAPWEIKTLRVKRVPGSRGEVHEVSLMEV